MSACLACCDKYALAGTAGCHRGSEVLRKALSVGVFPHQLDGPPGSVLAWFGDDDLKRLIGTGPTIAAAAAAAAVAAVAVQQQQQLCQCQARAKDNV
jgi:hypothetical protein